MMSRMNIIVAGLAVVASCAAIAFGVAWWTLKQEQSAREDAGPNVELELRKQMATLKFDMEALEDQRAELTRQLDELPDFEAQSEQMRERLRALPTAGELRREAVGIRPDGAHARTGEIPPTVLNRMSRELGLSPQQLRELQGQ